MTAPSRSDIFDDEWHDAQQPLPAWAHCAPLRLTGPVADADGHPRQKVRCDEHPGWIIEGGRELVLDGIEWHIDNEHAVTSTRPATKEQR